VIVTVRLPTLPLRHLSSLTRRELHASAHVSLIGFRPPSRSARTCRVVTGRASVENGHNTLSRPVNITAAFGGR